MNINDLYQRALGRDNSAEREMFDLLTVMFKAFLRRRNVGKEDAEDIVQCAVAKIARYYREESAKDNFAAWCQTVLRNQFVDFCRAQTSRRRGQEQMVALGQRLRPPEADSGLKSRLLNCLKKIHQANPMHARLLSLHYQGYSTAEICDRLGLTANHRRVAMCRARAMLRACLKESENKHE